MRKTAPKNFGLKLRLNRAKSQQIQPSSLVETALPVTFELLGIRLNLIASYGIKREIAIITQLTNGKRLDN